MWFKNLIRAYTTISLRPTRMLQKESRTESPKPEWRKEKMERKTRKKSIRMEMEITMMTSVGHAISCAVLNVLISYD